MSLVLPYKDEFIYKESGMPKFSEHEQTGKDESCGQVLKFRKYLKKNRFRDAVCNRKRKDPIWAL